MESWGICHPQGTSPRSSTRGMGCEILNGLGRALSDATRQKGGQFWKRSTSMYADLPKWSVGYRQSGSSSSSQSCVPDAVLQGADFFTRLSSGKTLVRAKRRSISGKLSRIWDRRSSCHSPNAYFSLPPHRTRMTFLGVRRRMKRSSCSRRARIFSIASPLTYRRTIWSLKMCVGSSSVLNVPLIK